MVKGLGALGLEAYGGGCPVHNGGRQLEVVLLTGSAHHAGMLAWIL